jgi:hypothetical protein
LGKLSGDWAAPLTNGPLRGRLGCCEEGRGEWWAEQGRKEDGKRWAAWEKERREQRGPAGFRPKKVLENSKGFSISYFDSNSNSIRISNEFYTNHKLKHSMISK